jgi:glycosyltransferase involved in cell wall biosynthesis
MTVRVFCDRVVAVCETANRNLKAGPLAEARKVTTIYNGTVPAPAGLEPAPSLPGFNLIHVGRLNEVKDQRTLLRAVALARAEVPDIRLTMVGGGALRAELEALAGELSIADRVVFLGERNDSGAWLAQADLFVLSSRTEGLPMSLLEAMAASVPQIVTDVGGMPEVLRMSQAGLIVPPNSAGDLARAMIEMSQRRGTLRELGERARSCYEKHFTLARMAQEYDRLYRSLK